MSLIKTDATVREILAAVKQQTGLSIVYNVNDLDLERKISVDMSNADVRVVLDHTFSGTDITYDIDDSHIILSKKKNVTSVVDGIVRGTVRDGGGNPLIGVTVLVQGTTRGVTTGLNGDYSINANNGDRLVFSYMGYESKTVTVTASQKNVNVTLLDSSTDIDEIVVTALGIKRKTKALGYNVQEVGGGELTAVKSTNFINSLSGKVAGLSVNSSSAGVGGASKVVMRGAKSISKDNNALYVIDGVPMINTSGGDIGGGLFSEIPKGEGISDINPDDIESISVLTGPAAAALYGSWAANGAILITTKKGLEGKTKVSISHSTNFSTPFVLPEFQNTYGNLPGSFSSWGAKLETPSSYDPAKFFQRGYNVINSVTLSTGTEKNQTFASASSTNAQGIMPNNDYNRYNFTIRNTSKLMRNKMTLDLGASYIIQDDINLSRQGVYFNPIIPVYLFPRGESFDNIRLYERYNEGRKIMTQYWPYGEEGLGMQNPYWTANRNTFSTNKKRYMFNAGLKYEITDWINVSGRVRVDNADSRWEKKLYASTIGLLSDDKGYYHSEKTNDFQVYADALVSINKRFGDFDFSVNMGASIFDVQYELSGVKGQLVGIPNLFAFHNIDLYARNSGVLEEGWREQTQSVFASAEIGYKNMLFLNATARNDWASMLANSAESSFFYPSVSLSALVSEMIKMPKWVSFLKVRGSYSSVGAPPQRFLTIPTFPYDGQGNLQTNTHMPVPKLYAERTKSYEVGINLKMFQSKLNIDLSLYKSNTYDQTFESEASPSSGYSSFYIQSGDIENKGIELSLGFNKEFNNFKWQSAFTYSANRNRIKKLVDNFPDPITGEPLTIKSLIVSNAGDYRMILKEGGRIGDIYTMRELRLDNQGMIYVDPDTNSLETVDNVRKVGNADPKANFGFRNSLSYKNFSLGILFTARVGGEVLSATQAIMDRYGVSKATARARDNGGVRVNNGLMDAKYFYEYIGGGQTGMLSHYVYSATNVRLQEITFGYDFPSKWFKNKIDLSVSFVGTNLWMIYNKAPFDPESLSTTGTYFQGLDYFRLPSTRNLGFSIKLQF